MDEGLAMDSEQRNTLNLNILFYFSLAGDRYYSLVLPAIAFFFSENMHELKYTISIYFFFHRCVTGLSRNTGHRRRVLKREFLYISLYS